MSASSDDMVGPEVTVRRVTRVFANDSDEEWQRMVQDDIGPGVIMGVADYGKVANPERTKI